MGAPAAGAVVLVRFPFSDLSQTKLRPAVILANVGRGDWILCQVTSKPYGDTLAVKLEDTVISLPGLFASQALPALASSSPPIAISLRRRSRRSLLRR